MSNDNQNWASGLLNWPTFKVLWLNLKQMQHLDEKASAENWALTVCRYVNISLGRLEPRDPEWKFTSLLQADELWVLWTKVKRTKPDRRHFKLGLSHTSRAVLMQFNKRTCSNFIAINGTQQSSVTDSAASDPRVDTEVGPRRTEQVPG